MKLRDSPLVCKPASLPPAEEWMGSVSTRIYVLPESSLRTDRLLTRHKILTRVAGLELQAAVGKPTKTHRLMGLAPKGLHTSQECDRHSVRSSCSSESCGLIKHPTAGEPLILGPPKTSFASAGRKSIGPQETSQKPSIGFDEADGGKDRKEMSFRSGNRSDRNGDHTREPRYGGATRLRGEKSENDWSAARQKASGFNGQETSMKKSDGSQNGRERREDRQSGEQGRHAQRNGFGVDSDRQAWSGRGRNQPSWFKNDDEKDNTADRENTRSRPWRDKDFGSTSIDHMGRAEQEPEWMDEPGPQEAKQVRTQDDFEQWKAKMKAGTSNGQDSIPVKEEDPTNGPDSIKEDTNIKAARTTKPLILNAGYDAFLNFGDKPSKGNVVVAKLDEGNPQAPTSGPKPTRGSKFKGLFDPTPAVEPIAEPPAKPASPLFKDSSAEDKEGFARILTLLGQQQSAGPEKVTPPRTKTQNLQNNPTSPLHSPATGENRQMFDFLGHKSPPLAHPQSKDGEFFLKLMQQRPEGPNMQPGSRRPFEGPGNLPLGNLMISPQENKNLMGGPPSAHLFNDPNRDDTPMGDKMNLNPNADRRQPPGFSDMPWDAHPQRPQQPPGFPPPGMARPPGLDPFPPGFPPQRGPPPGFAGPARPNNIPPGLLPSMMSDRGPQFGVRPGGPGPPPGYMNVNGPPPGLPGAPFSPDGTPFGGGAGFGDMGPGWQGFGHQQQQQQRR